MIQTSAVTSIHTRGSPDTKEDELLDPLWGLAGTIRNARALIVVEHGLNLMCGLIRRGCSAATILRPGAKPDADDYDLVFVPRVAALSSSADVIRLARRSLAPSGRLIAGVQDARQSAALGRRLRLNGFSALHSTYLPGAVLLCAELRRPS